MSSIRPELRFQDKSDETGFYRKYLKLGDKPDRTVWAVDRGDYYTVLDQDAILVAELIYKTNSVVKTSNATLASGQHKGIKYVTLSPQVFVNFLKMCVLDIGHKIEIYDKTWTLSKTASPGNLAEVDHLINSSDLNTQALIASLRLSGKNIGLSYIDSVNKIIGVVEFVDNDLFSNVESAMIQLGIKECLLAGNTSKAADPDYVKLEQVMNRCDVVVTHVKNSDYSTKNIEQDLVRLTGDDLVFSTNDVHSLDQALGCVNSLVLYLNLLNSDDSGWTLELYNLSQYLRLDYSAVKSLNLFPSVSNNNQNSMNKNNSLFGLLNHCKTVGGSRLLSQWLKQPLLDIKAITERQEIVQLLVDDMTMRAGLQEQFLNSVPDISKLTKKLASRKAKLDDVVRIYQLCTKLPDLLGLLIAEDKENTRASELIDEWFINPLQKICSSLLKFQELVETTIDLDALENATSISSSMVSVNPQFDENLVRVSKELEEMNSQMQQEHEFASDDLNMEMVKKLKLENHHVHGWCFRLTRTDSSVIRGNKRYRELQTVKAGVFFTTAKLSELASNVAELTEEYSKIQSGVVKEIIEISSSYSPILVQLSAVISKLDVLTSFAHVSSFAPIPYQRPKLYGLDDSSRKLKLIGARHPCLETQDDLTFIANDVVLTKDESEFAIITGPNMGGKSTYIRQVGVIALMAQIGCFLPCDEAEICVFDSILARVGASDSQLKGVSTFMSEMLEMSSILKTATSNSLVIIDELGRGTSTYDGFGLAYGISEYIANKLHSFTLFATHFHELTKLSELIPTVINLHVVAQTSTDGKDDDITLLYKVKPGISDKSFGINVAEIVKFPQKIINMAKRKAQELDDDAVYESAAEKIKATDEEVEAANELLKDLLKQWKSEADLSANSDEIVSKLKDLIGNEFKDKIAGNSLLKEMLTL
ncbi:hypothetical protein LJB42_001749 [Komagataella kurtzmanii]|nr:hypothetical protein LJB42_001749 [Komagataella kurtzmanii]